MFCQIHNVFYACIVCKRGYARSSTGSAVLSTVNGQGRINSCLSLKQWWILGVQGHMPSSAQLFFIFIQVLETLDYLSVALHLCSWIPHSRLGHPGSITVKLVKLQLSVRNNSSKYMS